MRFGSHGAAALVAAALVIFAGDAVSGVNIVGESERGLTLEYTLGPIVPVDAPERGVFLTAEGHSMEDRLGSAAVPVLAFTVALPPGATASATISGAKFADENEWDVAPIPLTTGDGIAKGEWAASEVVDKWVSVSDPGSVAGLHVSTITVRPVRFDRATGTTSILRSATIQVDFHGGRAIAAAATPDKQHELVRTLVLNHRSAGRFADEPATVKRKVAGDSFASSGNWIRMEISERGFYEVTYDDLVSVGVVNPRTELGNPASIRIYTGTGRTLPEDITDPRLDWMNQVAIEIAGGDDGSFDPGDAVRFFALSVRGFEGEFDPTSDDYYKWVAHRYADRNVYWLTWGGSFEEGVKPRMAELDGSAAVLGGNTPVVLETFTDRHHFENDVVQDMSRFGSDSFFYHKFQPRTSASFSQLETPDADTSKASRVIVEFFHYAFNTRSCGAEKVVVWVNDVLADTLEWDSCRLIDGHIAPAVLDRAGHFANDGSNKVKIEAGTGTRVFLSWIELAYDRYFRVDDGELHFRIDSAGAFQMPITTVAGEQSRIFDVTDPFGPIEIVGFPVVGQTAFLHSQVDAPKTFQLVSASAWRSPISMERIILNDLRTPSVGAEYIAIVHDPLVGALSDLTALRSTQYSTKTVLLSDVMNQFGWGLDDDPSAIRDFLAWAYHEWPDQGKDRPLFVLLVGDATQNFQERLEAPNKNDMPTFYRIAKNGNIDFTYPTDDFFTYLDPDSGSIDYRPDVAIGRYAAGSQQELRLLVDKTVEYTTDPELGSWRNRMLFLADDELQGTGFDCAFLTDHTDDTEESAQLVPDDYQKWKIYLFEYPANVAHEKPAATEEYLRRFDLGYLVSSYIGHGGFDKVADENLFSSSAAGQVRNGRRLNLFTAWSCSIGSFDILNKSSLSEELILKEDGGCIGSFSSAAPAFGFPSARLNRDFFSAVFGENYATIPIGTAAQAAKAVMGGHLGQDKINDEKYVLLADPALELGVPQLAISFDGGPELEFRRGTDVVVRGSIVDTTGALVDEFNGLCEITIHGMVDSSGYTFIDTACRGTVQFPKLTRSRYELIGPTFFRGNVEVTSGRFEAPFFVPTDTRVGDLGVISAYAYQGAGLADAGGGQDSIRVSPEPPGTVFSDNTGPTAKILIDGAELRDGLPIRPESQFEIELEDPHGINLQGVDEFFSIHLVFDGGVGLVLDDLFEYDKNSYRKGRLSFKLSEVSSGLVETGTHELSFRAADNLSNRVEIDKRILLVEEGNELLFQQDILNYPNPFHPGEEETQFFVDVTQSADVTIGIFTVTGKLIRELGPCTVFGPTFLEGCEWDGLDRDGEIVGNGTYLVRATAESLDGETRIESLGRIVVLRGVD